MKRAAIYIRVSTMEQAKEGYSISAQTTKLKQYAQAKEFYVQKIYSDPGFSGAKLERPALQEMIQDITANKIDVVLVYKLDRLSRSQKNTLYLIEDVFMANNVDFISLQESFDTSTPFGRATIGMLSVFAQLERDTITERMHMGRTERAKQGYYHGSGVVPIGYDYIDGNLIVNDYEAMIVREIFDLYVNHNKGQQHITTRMVKKYPDKVKTLTLVKYALQNPLYIGKISWDGNIYQGLHQPIISTELFEKTQIIFKERAKNGTTNSNQQALLAGLIYCGHCGAKIYREVAGGSKHRHTLKDGTVKSYTYKYNYYTCRSVKKMMPSLVKDWNCKQPRLRCEKVEEEVIKGIQELDLDEIESRIIDDKSSTDTDIKILQGQINKKKTEMSKVLDLYQYGTIDVEILNDRVGKIQKELDTLTFEIEQLKTEDTNSDIKNTLKELETFDWSTDDKRLKIDIIKKIVKRVELLDDQILVTYNF